MNRIGYDRWQAMIRLPYLAIVALWIGQRARLYPGQVNTLFAELNAIQQRDPASLLGQLAADSAAELREQVKSFDTTDVTHMPLQCERVLTAARRSMSAEQFAQFIADHIRMIKLMNQSVPWLGRFRALLATALPQDPRTTLMNALESAEYSQSFDKLQT